MFLTTIRREKTIVPSYKGNGAEIGFDYLDNVYGDKNVFSYRSGSFKI
jgi:hypothetical protein